MKKYFSRIIAVVLLTIFLWSGVGTFGVPAANAEGWSLFSIAEITGNAVMGINGVILQLIAIPVCAVFLRIASAILDMSVTFTLSTDIYRQSALGVVSIWVLIRDICNITFIFILLWSAIQMIIGIAGSNAKKMVANVIIAALLINFSLFITRVVIDAGNILGVTLYNQILSTNPDASGIGTILMDELGMTNFLDTLRGMFTETKSVFSVAFGVTSYLQLATILIAFLVFVYAMLLMVTRSVILIFLAALSPIGFMGDVLPKLSEYSKQWREALYGQVMIAPIFLLFVYLVIKVSSTISDTVTSLTGSSSLAGQLSTTGIANAANQSAAYLGFFKYVMIIILLIAAVKITKKMSGPLGAAVEKIGMAAVGIAAGAATGGAALLARQSLGRGGAFMLEGERGKNLRARADAGSTWARMQLATYEKGANSTYDVRNVKAVNKAAGFVGDKVGVSFNAGKTSGVYSKDGKQTGFAGSQKAEEEKANKAYNEAGKGVTAADRTAARGALERRDAAVEANLNGNVVHGRAKQEVARLKNEGLATNNELLTAKQDHRNAEIEYSHAQQKLQVAPSSQKAAALKEFTEAKKALTEAKKIRDEKEKELIGKNEEKYKDEIEIQNKKIKEETRKAQIDVEKGMNPDDKLKIARVERARNLAQSMREGKVGIAGILRRSKRNGEIANKMENQKEKSEAEKLREELADTRREMKEQSAKK